jgi:RimJ/RimL family protein N-acetyltransferase
MPHRIAPMRAEEADVVAALVRAVIEPLDIYVPAARAAEISRHDAPSLRLKIADDPFAVLVAWEHDVPVGFLVSNLDDGLLWLAWFGVSHTARARGLGRALLAAFEQTAGARGAHKAWCDCRIDNDASRHLLTSCGYRLLTELRNHWHGQDFYLWEKALP